MDAVNSEVVTVLALATHRLGRPARHGGDFEDAGLPMMGGCSICAATVAAYNSTPSKDGYLRCLDCIGNDGWTDVEDCNKDLFN